MGADGMVTVMAVMEEMWPYGDALQVACITTLGESLSCH